MVVCAALTAALLPSAALALPRLAPPATDSAGSVRAQVAAMQAEVERASHLLADGTIAWEQGRARLDQLLQRQFAADRTLEVTDADVAQAQRRLDAIANAAYRNPVPQSLTMALSIDLTQLTQSLETVHVLRRTSSSQREALATLHAQRVSASDLAAQRDSLRQQAQEAQARLDDQLVALQTLAAQTNNRLQAAQARLERVRAQERARQLARMNAAAAARARAMGALGGGAECTAPADGQYANGFLPTSVLCPLRMAPGQRLTASAAAAFDRLSAARQAATGSPLCVTDSYRDYAGQVDVFSRKPSLAATPGSSQHGWGLALDLCGGVENAGSEVFQWMKANAPSYGFVHPPWAEPGGSRPEAWHWEYQG